MIQTVWIVQRVVVPVYGVLVAARLLVIGQPVTEANN